MKNMKNLIEKIKKEFDEEFYFLGDKHKANIGNFICQAQIDTIKEVIKEIDKIELHYPSTTNDEWKLYRRIRNGLRDKFFK